MFYQTLARVTRTFLPHVTHVKPVFSPGARRFFWNGAAQKFNADEFADMMRRLGEAYQKAHGAMEQAKTEVNALETRISDAGVRTELIENKMTEIEGHLETADKKTEVLETALVVAQEKVTGLETHIESADEKTLALETRIEHVETTAQNLSETLAAMEESTQQLVDNVSETQEKINILSARMEELKQDAGDVNEKIAELIAETQKLQNEYDALTELLEDQTIQLNNQADKLKNFKNSLVVAVVILVVMVIAAGCIINELKDELRDAKKEADRQRVDMTSHKKEIADNHEKISAIVAALNIQPKIDRYAQLAENQKRVQMEMLSAIDDEKKRIIAKRDKSYPSFGPFSRYRYHVEKLTVLRDIEENYEKYDSDTIISLLIKAYNDSGYMPDSEDETFLSRITEMINRKIFAYTHVDNAPRST